MAFMFPELLSPENTEDADFTMTNMLLADRSLEQLEIAQSTCDIAPVTNMWQSTTDCVGSSDQRQERSSPALCGREQGAPAEGSMSRGSSLIILRRTRLANNILTASTPNLTGIFYQALQEIIREAADLFTFVATKDTTFLASAPPVAANTLGSAPLGMTELLGLLGLSVDQTAELLALQALYDWKAGVQAQKRMDICGTAKISNGRQPNARGPSAGELGLISAGVDELRASIGAQVQDLCTFTWKCLCECLRPVQAAMALVAAYPHFPDFQAVAMHLRKEQGDGDCTMTSVQDDVQCPMPSVFAAPASAFTGLQQQPTLRPPMVCGQVDVPNAGERKRRLLARAGSWAGPNCSSQPIIAPQTKHMGEVPGDWSGGPLPPNSVFGHSTAPRPPLGSPPKPVGMPQAAGGGQSASHDLADLEAVMQSAFRSQRGQRMLKNKRSAPVSSADNVPFPHLRGPDLATQMSAELRKSTGQGAIPLGGWPPHYKPPGNANDANRNLGSAECSGDKPTMPVGSDGGPADDLLLEQLGIPQSVFQTNFVGRPSLDERLTANLPSRGQDLFGRSISMGPTEFRNIGQGLRCRTSRSDDVHPFLASTVLPLQQGALLSDAGQGVSRDSGVMQRMSGTFPHASSQALERRSYTLQALPFSSMDGDGISISALPRTFLAASGGLSAAGVSCEMAIGQQHPIGAATSDDGFNRLFKNPMRWDMPMGTAPVGEQNMGQASYK